MHWKISGVLGATGLLFLIFAPACLFAQGRANCRHQRQTHARHKTHGTKKLCDPAFSDPRAQDCQYNRAGPGCERCKEGYYGNPVKRTCRPCPCPSTWNNLAVSCTDLGSGVVQCVCKRGYSGSRCERCAHGYYGNPLAPGGSCRPCDRGAGVNTCDRPTEDCDSCSRSTLADVEKTDRDLTRLRLQLRNVGLGAGLKSTLKNLEANMSDARIQFVQYHYSMRRRHPEVEQLEEDVRGVTDDLSQLTDKIHGLKSDGDTVSQNVYKTKWKAGNVLPGADTLLSATQDLIKQVSEAKPPKSVPLSEKEEAGMMEEARRSLQEVRERGCAAARDAAAREQGEAHRLLTKVTGPAVTGARQALTVSLRFLRDRARLLLEERDRVDAARSRNLKSLAALQHLQRRHRTTRKQQAELTKDLLKNLSGAFARLEEKKKEAEELGAQLNGGGRELLTRLNTFLRKKTVMDRAEEHVERLSRDAARLQQALHNATSSNKPRPKVFDKRTFGDIMGDIAKAEITANQSREAADGSLKDLKEAGLVTRAEGLKENSSYLQVEAEKLPRALSTTRDRLWTQREKRESLRTELSAAVDKLATIRDANKLLTESAKAAATKSDATVRNISQRLRTIGQELDKIPAKMEQTLGEVQQSVNALKTALPVLTDNLKRIESLKRKAPPSGNMTESIERIKDVIKETRNFVNRLSTAMTFNGRGHVELHPPRNIEDIKAFTAVDLLLNRRQTGIAKPKRRRNPRQDQRGDVNLFVLYLGNKNASGDFFGMAIRNNALICVYKLGGVVHEVETKHQIITSSSVDASHFDRVVFSRVYQDAEVIITKNFTSQTSVNLAPYRHHPNTTSGGGVLGLDPDRVAFYVGGYPDDFTPPSPLRYTRYRGAMKLSYINDQPLSLFNFKEAVNMEPKQPPIKIPQWEVSDYYDGTGYRMARLRESDRKKRRLFRFHTNSRETDALLFYIGNEESFFCLSLERGFLLLRGEQAGRRLRAQSADKVSLFDQEFTISAAEQFIVHYGRQQISSDHVRTNYKNYYVGGLPAQLRQRWKIRAPPLRGCVDHLKADAEVAEYSISIGVSDGCPLPLLGVRTATLTSPLPAVWDQEPVLVSVGFSTTHTHGALVRISSGGPTSAPDLQLALDDGQVVFKSTNEVLRSDGRFSDGKWHYFSAARRFTRWELSIDNANVKWGRAPNVTPAKQKGGKFQACITNLYTRRPQQNIIPADLSSFSQRADAALLGRCGGSAPQSSSGGARAREKHPRNKPVQAASGSRCEQPHPHLAEQQLYHEHSWFRYTVSHQDLNYRPHFSLDVKTKSSKGLIFHVGGAGGGGGGGGAGGAGGVGGGGGAGGAGGAVPLLALYMANGKIKMSLGQNRIIQHKQKSNDGHWHRVEFSVESSSFHLVVDGVRVTDGRLPNNEGSSLNLHNPVHVGSGVKGSAIKGHNIPINSVVGCIRDVKMNDITVGEPEGSHKTLPCFDGATGMGTYFGGGHVILDHDFQADAHFELTFELRPRHLTGLLFFAPNEQASVHVFLMENKVGVRVNDVSVSVAPPQSLCDGEFHTVAVSKLHNVVKLVVDSLSEEKTISIPSRSRSTTPASLFIGGTPGSGVSPVPSPPFVGCLRNVKIDGKPVWFETGARVVGAVFINQCPKV